MAQDNAAGSTVFCTSCGYKLGPEDRFCPECGASRPATPAQPVTPPFPPPPTQPFGSYPPSPSQSSSAYPPPAQPAPGFPPPSYGGGFNPLAGGMAMTMGPTMRGSEGDLIFDVAYPEHLSRLLIFVKWLLIIPHWIVLWVLTALVTYLVTPIAWICILITGRYPRGLWDFSFGTMRWAANVYAYLFLQRDEYPPFSMDAGEYPVTFEMEYPHHLSRLLIFVKWLLIIPSLIVFAFVLVIWLVVLFIAWWAILFTGHYPRGMFNFAIGTLRWGFRLNLYHLLLTDKYPGFRLSQ